MEHKTTGVLSSTQWHAKNVKRGSLNQSTTCGSGCRNDRGEVENHGSFQVKCFGVLRYNKTSSLSCNGCSCGICCRARVCSSFKFSKHRPARVQTCGCWGEWCCRPQCHAKRTTETGSRDAQSVKTRPVSVLTLLGRCYGHMGGQVHPA